MRRNNKGAKNTRYKKNKLRNKLAAIFLAIVIFCMGCFKVLGYLCFVARYFSLSSDARYSRGIRKALIRLCCRLANFALMHLRRATSTSLYDLFWFGMSSFCMKSFLSRARSRLLARFRCTAPPILRLAVTPSA